MAHRRPNIGVVAGAGKTTPSTIIIVGATTRRPSQRALSGLAADHHRDVNEGRAANGVDCSAMLRFSA
jgi:hypothetical protein